MKRCFLLMTTLILSVWFSISAYSFIVVDGIEYFPLSQSTVKVIPSQNGYSGDVVIPNSVKWYEREYLVTSIGESAFEGCTGLTSITIPNSVTSIGESAFAGCTGLTSITIPGSVTSIGDNVLVDCNGIKDIVTVDDMFVYLPRTYSGHYSIPENISQIIGGAFADCSGLTSITIPNSVTSIEKNAFYACSGLTSVTIPNSVTSIEKNAFAYCTNLTSVTIPNSVTNIGDWVFYGCGNLNNTIIVNDMLAYLPKTYSGNYSIPGNITRIIGGALADCTGLTSVIIPNSVKSIGGYAFYGCTGLTSVTIPNSVTSIEKNAFGYCI